MTRRDQDTETAIVAEPPVNTEAMTPTAEPTAEPIDWEAIADKRAERIETTRRAILETLYPDGDGNLVAHARRELERAGLLKPDSDYGGMLGRSVLDLVRVFAGEGHSGASAGIAADLFNRLARFDVLSPITAHPSEWMEVEPGVYQSKRKPSVLWRDGEATWYDLDKPA
jgi:hypothetical protein